MLGNVLLAGAGIGGRHCRRLALHTNEQALQEFDEVTEPYRAIHAMLDTPHPGQTV